MRGLTKAAVLTATGIGAGIVGGSEALAQEAPSLPLANAQFNEIVHPAAKISGARLLGFYALQTADSAESADSQPEESFRAWIPADWSGGRICLRVMSADGLYESANPYLAPEEGWEGGDVRLGYPTQSPEEIARRSGEELAFSVTRGDCDAAEPEAALAARPGATAPGAEALLLLNAFRAEQTYVEVKGRPEAPEVVCAPVGALVRMAYDTACRVPAEVFAEGRAELLVMPVKNGELGREIPLTLRFGPLDDAAEASAADPRE